MGKARAAPKAAQQSLCVEEAQTPRAPPLLGLDPLHFLSWLALIYCESTGPC